MTAAATEQGKIQRLAIMLLASTHAMVDFYQGAVAALVPFLVLERGYSYAEAAVVVLASALASSVVQPLFGVLSDKWNMSWVVPAAVLMAGAGIAGFALSEELWVTVLLAGLSGVGVAAFHPAAASLARRIVGNNHVMMAWFSFGGNVGFAISPLFIGVTVGLLGLAASPLLFIPACLGVLAVTGAFALARRLGAAGARTTAVDPRRDDWVSFWRLCVAMAARSIVFVCLGAFVVLFMQRVRGFDEAAASASLFVLYAGGAFGTALGGYLTKRWQRVAIVRWAYLLSVPLVLAFLLVPGPLSFAVLALASLTLYVPFSLHVTLGQDYLPHHMGTASGVTLGLAVSVGGLFSPLVGGLADRVGLEAALLPLAALPLLGALALWGMRDPAPRPVVAVGHAHPAGATDATDATGATGATGATTGPDDAGHHVDRAQRSR